MELKTLKIYIKPNLAENLLRFLNCQRELLFPLFENLIVISDYILLLRAQQSYYQEPVFIAPDRRVFGLIRLDSIFYST